MENNLNEQLKSITESIYDKLNDIKNKYIAQHGFEAQLNKIVAAGKAGIEKAAEQTKCKICSNGSGEGSFGIFKMTLDRCKSIYANISVAGGYALQKMKHFLIQHHVAAKNIGLFVPEYELHADESSAKKIHPIKNGGWRHFMLDLKEQSTAAQNGFIRTFDKLAVLLMTNEKNMEGTFEWRAVEIITAAMENLNESMKLLKNSFEISNILYGETSDECQIDNATENNTIKILQKMHAAHMEQIRVVLETANGQFLAAVFLATRNIQ